jgi:hypothetical protein
MLPVGLVGLEAYALGENVGVEWFWELAKGKHGSVSRNQGVPAQSGDASLDSAVCREEPAAPGRRTWL